jgi:hypothetical protein
MSKLLFLPVNATPLPDIRELLVEDKAKSYFSAWNFRRLTRKQDTAYLPNDWDPELRSARPDLIAWFDQLPWMGLRNVKLNYQTKASVAHVDFADPSKDPELWDNNHRCEPCGYRILVRGKRTGDLWVKRSDGSQVYCTIPDDSDTYLLDHTSGIHGVDYDPDGRWTIYCQFDIDPVRHQILLQRSLERFGDLAIYDSDDSDDQQ